MSIDLAKNFELPKKSNFATAGALVLVAALLAGCSSVPNWANPVEWYEGAADAIFGDKESESISSGDARRPTYTSGENKDFPKLASVPERPKAPTIGERKRLAERLTSDRENAKYSQETIRRQSEAAVSTPPPPPAEAATASGQPLPAPFTAVRPVAPPAPAQNRLHAAIIDATVSGTTGIRGIASWVRHQVPGRRSLRRVPQRHEQPFPRRRRSGRLPRVPAPAGVPSPGSGIRPSAHRLRISRRISGQGLPPPVRRDLLSNLSLRSLERLRRSRRLWETPLAWSVSKRVRPACRAGNVGDYAG